MQTLYLVAVILSIVALSVSVPVDKKSEYLDDPVCVDPYLEYPCEGMPNGDYAVCSDCQFGYYATCSNQYFYFRPCPKAYYPGARNLANMVFDEASKSCQKYSPSCPQH